MATSTQTELLQAAQQWRASVFPGDTEFSKQLAERTARNLERQAETSVATCVCCGKSFGQHAGIYQA